MKKKIIIIVVLLLVLIPSCYFCYKYFTKDDIVPNIPNEPTPNEPNISPTESLKGSFSNRRLKVDASLATQPLMDAFISYFGNDEMLKSIQDSYTNTHPAYIALVDGTKDLIIVTEPSEEEMAYASSKGVELEVTKVVNEGFVFFTNKDNKVSDLGLADIIDIYAGKKNNWKEVGGDDEVIIPYQRPTNSGSQTGMKSLVMKNVPLRKPTTEEMVATMAGIVDIVADYENNKNGLGYSYYYYANIMYGNPNIKFLGINGVKPTYNTIQDETYPLMTAYYVVTRKDASEDTKRLKKALLSQEGADVAKEAGYVPIKSK